MSIEIGTAGEHLVCADLLLAGYRAFQSAQGLPYDLVLDVNGRLVRVAVKSTGRARPRPAREGSRICYQFNVGRARRLRSGKTDNRRVTAAEADLVALVALDLRLVAYVPIVSCVSFLHIDAPGAPPGKNKFGPKSRRRKQFQDFALSDALKTMGLLP